MDSKKIGILVLLSAFATASFADLVIDGRLDPEEGYSSVQGLDMTIDRYGTLTDGARLWVHQDPTSLDVCFGLSFSTSFVDNTYGEHKIGWGHDSPGGKGHEFRDLTGSDKARFEFRDGLGNVVLDIDFDYMSCVGGGDYASTGAESGDGDAAVYVGDASGLLDFGTSLDYNFNVLGYELTEDSPATNTQYAENPSYPGWEYEVHYEGRVDGSLFANGFAGVRIPVAHVSPNKLGHGRVYFEEPHAPEPVIPEPASVVVFVTGTAALLMWRRERRTRS